MVYGPIPPLSNANRGWLDPSLYERTGPASMDPNFMQLFMAQMGTPNLDILVGAPEEAGTSLFGGVIGGVPSTASPLFGGFALGGLPTEYTGQTSLYGGFSPQMEMSIWSNLIGRTIEGINPQTGERILGEVKSIVLQTGQAMLEVNVEGTSILMPTGNFTKVM